MPRLLALLLLLGAASCAREAAEPAPGGALLPGLAERQDQVQRIELIGAGGQRLLGFRHTADGWVLAERDDWRADDAKLAQYLLQLAQAKRVAAKTDRAALYPRIGVEDVADADAGGTELRLGGKGIDARVVIGKPHKPSAGRYARLVGEARSWQVDTDIGFDPEPTAWLDHRVLAVPLARVERVRLRPRNAPEFSLVNRDDRFGPDDAPSAAMRDSQAGDEIAAALADFQVEDVAAQGGELPASQQLDYELVDGGVVSVWVWRDGQRDWARLEASVDAARAQAWARQSQKPQAEAETRARAAQWDASFSGRKFLLSPALARTLTLDHSQILEGTPAP